MTTLIGATSVILRADVGCHGTNYTNVAWHCWHELAREWGLPVMMALLAGCSERGLWLLWLATPVRGATAPCSYPTQTTCEAEPGCAWLGARTARVLRPEWPHLLFGRCHAIWPGILNAPPDPRPPCRSRSPRRINARYANRAWPNYARRTWSWSEKSERLGLHINLERGSSGTFVRPPCASARAGAGTKDICAAWHEWGLPVMMAFPNYRLRTRATRCQYPTASSCRSAPAAERCIWDAIRQRCLGLVPVFQLPGLPF